MHYNTFSAALVSVESEQEIDALSLIHNLAD